MEKHQSAANKSTKQQKVEINQIKRTLNRENVFLCHN